jgi:hypothetical protein
MNVQNIFRMQAIVIGLGAALFLASPAPAQEIVNTSFNDGPNVTSFDQPAAPAAAQVTAAQPAAANSNASAPAIAAAAPVVTNKALVSVENSAERWVIISSFFGVMMLALYALAEVRRARKSTNRPAAMFDRSAAYN